MSITSTAESPQTRDEPSGEAAPSGWHRVSDYPWLCLVLLAHVPLLIVHFSHLWEKPEYQFFPVLLAVIGYLVWTRLERLPAASQVAVRRWPSYVLLTISIVLLAVGTLVVYSPWLATLSFILSSGAVLLLSRERYHLPNRFGIWVLLCLLLPMPLNVGTRLSQSLQRFTTFVSAEILQRLDIPNIAEGTILTLPSKQLFVEEACSGVVSLMSIVTACLIVAVLRSRPAIHTILLVSTGIVWASVTNVLRIVALAVSEERYGVDLSQGWQHDALGICLFAVAILLALSADALLCFVLKPIEGEGLDPTWSTWSIRAWNRIASLGGPKLMGQEAQTVDELDQDQGSPGYSVAVLSFVAAFCLVGLTGLGISLARMVRTQESTTILATQAQMPFIDSLSATTLPKQVGQWTLVDYGQSHEERLFAQDSRIWSYSNGLITANFSCDFTFPGWHDLCECYRVIDWDQVRASKRCTPSAEFTRLGPYLETEFTKSGNRRGVLLFTHVLTDGTPVDPPTTTMGNLRSRFSAEISPTNRRSYQVQLWVTAKGTIRESDKKSAHELYQKLSDMIQKKMIAQVSSGDPESGGVPDRNAAIDRKIDPIMVGHTTLATQNIAMKSRRPETVWRRN